MKIEGLTERQRELADRIWAIDGPDQLVEFFQTIPRSLLHDAYVVYMMIIQACWDDTDLGEMTEAREVIDYIRSLP